MTVKENENHQQQQLRLLLLRLITEPFKFLLLKLNKTNFSYHKHSRLKPHFIVQLFMGYSSKYYLNALCLNFFFILHRFYQIAQKITKIGRKADIKAKWIFKWMKKRLFCVVDKTVIFFLDIVGQRTENIFVVAFFHVEKL